MIQRRASIVGLVCGAVGAAAQLPQIDARVHAVLTTELRFSDGELSDLRRGQVVKHGLPSRAPGEIAVTGAVRIHAPKATFFTRVRDIARFKNSPEVVQIARFSNPPIPADLAGLTIDKDDFDVRSCRVGDCGVRLPAAAIERIALAAGTNTPDAQSRGTAIFKQLLFDEVTAYVSGGSRMTQYDDGSKAIRPGEEFEAILAGMPELDILVPGLSNHLKRFQTAPLPDAEDFLYWSKEKFGIAPFITVTHVTIVCPSTPTCVMATRDVYASRYLDASVALAIATDVGGEDAFDLVYDNRSRANALKGGLSGLRRALTERRARGALEDSLRTIRTRVEQR
jgi:hypothetical protein